MLDYDYDYGYETETERDHVLLVILLVIVIGSFPGRRGAPTPPSVELQVLRPSQTSPLPGPLPLLRRGRGKQERFLT